jgi:hypothetical protein
MCFSTQNPEHELKITDITNKILLHNYGNKDACPIHHDRIRGHN